MLGLILGRSCGLACVELRLGRFRDEALEDSFRGTGPLGDGIAVVHGLGAREADEGSKAGVPFVDSDGVRIEVSIRLTLGRSCVDVAASGKEISSISSSGISDSAS
jgi:hypothetical protein